MAPKMHAAVTTTYSFKQTANISPIALWESTNAPKYREIANLDWYRTWN